MTKRHNSALWTLAFTGRTLGGALLAAAVLSQSGAAQAIPQGTVSAQRAQVTVTTGMTLYSLARSSGVSVQDIMTANELTSDRLMPGMVLTLPARALVTQVVSINPAAPLQIAQIPAAAGPPLSAAPVLPELEPPVVSAAPVVSQSFQGTPELGLPRDWWEAAERSLGTPYKYGGVQIGAGGGVDCSALTQWIYRWSGQSMPRTSREQAQMGQQVNGELAPGDLLFFSTSGTDVNHVGIYLTGGLFISANSYAGYAAVDAVASPYWKAAFRGARRILPGS